MLDPRRLRLLVELSERQTITGVADALHFTPSTVSHGLSTLEREVGVALLERTARSVRLTPAGETLARDARGVLADLSAAAVEARAVGRLDVGHLTLATFPSAGAAFVADAIGTVLRRHPGLEPKVIDAEPTEAVARVRSGEIDVAVVYEYPLLPPLDLAGLDRVALLDDAIALCPPGRDPRFAGDAGIGSLRNVPLVGGRPDSACHAFTRALCRESGFEPRIAFETDDIAFTCALIDAGVAAAILPRLLLSTAPRTVRSHELSAAGSRSVYAVHRASAAGLPSVVAVVEALAGASHRPA